MVAHTFSPSTRETEAPGRQRHQGGRGRQISKRPKKKITVIKEELLLICKFQMSYPNKWQGGLLLSQLS